MPKILQSGEDLKSEAKIVVTSDSDCDSEIVAAKRRGGEGGAGAAPEDYGTFTD